MHQHDVSRNPLNPVGCQPVVFGLSKFSNLLALVRAYSQVLKKHPGQRICKERFRDSAQHWLMIDPTSILAFLGGEIGGPASATKESSWQKVWGVWKTPACSAFQHCQGDTIQKTETVKRISSLTVGTAWHLHVCSLFGTGDRYELALPHERLVNRKDTQDIEPGHIFVFPAWQNLFNAGIILARNQKKPWHGSISNQRLFLTQGSRCLENSNFLSFQHCQGDTLHWPDPSKNGNCEKNSSLTVITARHLHVCSLLGTGDRCELDSWKNVPSNGKSAEALN